MLYLKLRRIILLGGLVAGLGILYSCGNSASSPENSSAEKVVKQNPDGSISLSLDNADFYSDVINRICNTAEWSVVVSKSGRYDVWLSSATRDTTNLNYKNTVMVSLRDLDLEIEGLPTCDKIIHNSKDVKYPFFKADSYLGTVYIRDTGKMNIQVNSEQILPKDYLSDNKSGDDPGKLLSVSFKPSLR